MNIATNNNNNNDTLQAKQIVRDYMKSLCSQLKKEQSSNNIQTLKQMLSALSGFRRLSDLTVLKANHCIKKFNTLQRIKDYEGIEEYSVKLFAQYISTKIKWLC